MPVTVQHVAKSAGVSRSTANMILSGKAERYAIDTCERVKKAAVKLGYRPNIAAQSLRHQRSFLIGGIFNNINAFYATDYMFGMQTRTLDESCAPTVLMVNNPEQELKALGLMADRRVDGLIVNPIPPEGEASAVVDEIHRLHDRGLPIVELLGQQCDPRIPSVTIDGYRAGYEMTRRAIELGCERPMLVMQENITPQSKRDANNGFLIDLYRGSDEAVKEAGHEPWHVIYSTSPGWNPLAKARSIIADHKPAGIITLSRAMTSRFAFLANTEPGLVAEQFVLCGVEHLLGHVDCRFNKVIVNHSMQQAVERATDMLFSMIDDADDIPKSVTLPPTLQVVNPLTE